MTNGLQCCIIKYVPTRSVIASLGLLFGDGRNTPQELCTLDNLSKINSTIDDMSNQSIFLKDSEKFMNEVLTSLKDMKEPTKYLIEQLEYALRNVCEHHSKLKDGKTELIDKMGPCKYDRNLLEYMAMFWSTEYKCENQQYIIGE